MNEWMDGWRDRWRKEEVNEWVDACMHGHMDRWVNELDGWTMDR